MTLTLYLAVLISVIPVEAPRPSPVALRLGELNRQRDAAFETLSAARRAVVDEATDATNLVIFWSTVTALAIEARSLAEDHPNDPAADDALAWVLTGPQGGEPEELWEEYDRALILLTQSHVASDDLTRLAYSAGGYYLWHTDEAEHFLRAVVETNPNRTIRGTALFSLAQRYAGQAQFVRRLRDPIEGPAMRDRLKPAVLSQLDGADSESLRSEARSLYRRVIAEYADVLPFAPYGVARGELARGALFQMENLAIGRSIPELAGNDTTGKPLRLSDQRGKVVLLVYWATWCGPCMAMVPHERELVARYEGRPFVVLGVNADEDPATLAEVTATEGITWRSFADSDKSLASAWGIVSWPDSFLIDARGVIRYRDLHGELLDRAVARLVAEAEAIEATKP